MSTVHVVLERPRAGTSGAKSKSRLTETLTFGDTKEGIIADIAVPDRANGDASGWKWNFTGNAPSVVFIAPDLPGEGDSASVIGYRLAAGETLSVPARKAGERAMVAPLP